MRDKIEVADVVVSTNHVVFLANRFQRLISLSISAIFVSGTSGITAILKYRSVNPIVFNFIPIIDFVNTSATFFCFRVF